MPLRFLSHEDLVCEGQKGPSQSRPCPFASRRGHNIAYWVLNVSLQWILISRHLTYSKPSRLTHWGMEWFDWDIQTIQHFFSAEVWIYKVTYVFLIKNGSIGSRDGLAADESHLLNQCWHRSPTQIYGSNLDGLILSVNKLDMHVGLNNRHRLIYRLFPDDNADPKTQKLFLKMWSNLSMLFQELSFS